MRLPTLAGVERASSQLIPFHRETPLVRAGMARAGSADLPDGESGIFLRKGLDRKISDLPVGQ